MPHCCGGSRVSGDIMSTRSLLLFAAASLAACSSGDDGLDTTTPPVSAAELCVSSDCGERTVLLPLAGAENLIFSPEGRLFVSGGENLFEIHKNDDDSFRADVISSESAGFTGLVVRAGYLYAASGDGRLWGGALTATPRIVPIHTMTGMCIANGAALGADGRIYVVDEPLSICVPDPKIKRFTLDAADPLKVVDEEVWLQGSPLGLLPFGIGNTLRFPNGLQSDGPRFYGTDGGSIYTIDLLEDGSAGPVTPIYFTVDAHDDLGLVADGVLLTNFLTGRISLISRDGELQQATAPATFSFPSSVRLGRPPMFEATDIVVTETGLLLDHSLPLDYISVFRRRN
jgi:hypothetical protein